MKLYVKKIATCILGAFFMVGTLSGCSGSSVSSADYVKAVLVQMMQMEMHLI